jgi:threonine dehydrogenase-like Zn-dependent dehydrogenase
MSIPNQERPHPLTGESLPLTIGHEFCGRIKSAPEGSKLKVGQAVMVDPRIVDHTCSRCLIKATHACKQIGCIGVSGGGGGFAETCAVDQELCHSIPEALLPNAAVIEPLTVAWHALKVPGIKTYKGRTVLIVGGGPIGIALIFTLRHWGAEKIIVSEPTAKRRQQNKDLADEVINPLEQKVGDVCREFTAGEGVDFVFDAAGSASGLVDGIDALRYRGTYVTIAAYKGPVSRVCFVTLSNQRRTPLTASISLLFPSIIFFSKRSLLQVLVSTHEAYISCCHNPFLNSVLICS